MAGAHGKLVVGAGGVWLVVAFTHQNHAALSADESDPRPTWQEEAARQSNDGGSSQGFGYTARALLERRVTSNWFVGTAIDIQQAKDYAPSHFLLYVRYSAAGWQGDMDLPPQPLIPYADW
ncbi:cellulose synthase subunit BcsC-related outer membrane protein [Escherichia coli]